jgi:ubiquitin-like protein ATG12
VSERLKSLLLKMTEEISVAAAGTKSYGDDELSVRPRESSDEIVSAQAASKVKILFVPVGGDALALSNSKFALNGSRLMIDAEKLLRSRLPKSESNRSFYFFCCSSFSPTPDQTIQDLYDCFGESGRLVLQYAVKPAWG